MAPQDKTENSTGPINGNNATTSPQLDEAAAAKIAKLQSTLRENFGKVVLSMMMLPRYRDQMLGDLQHLVLDPMLQDRVAIAHRGSPDAPAHSDMAGFAIWASVSEGVDARIRNQIKNGVFPVRLKAGDWNSGSINWLLDVVAADRATTASVIANFRQVAKDGELRLHPLITRLVDGETLEKMGARKDSGQAEARPETPTAQSQAS